MSKAALNLAIERAGGIVALSRLINVDYQRLGYWARGNKKATPAEFVLKIEQATGISRHDLRPDIYPREERHDA